MQPDTSTTPFIDMVWFFDALVFRAPYMLWFAVPIVLGAALLVWLNYRATRCAYTHPWIRQHVTETDMLPPWRYSAVVGGLVTSIVALVAISAEPERRVLDREPVYAHMRVVFAIDTSRSMEYAYDVEPYRLAAAKSVIRDFTGLLWSDPELHGAYSFSLIPFSGAAIPLYSGFTTNREEFLSLLELLDGNTIAKQGTSILAALLAYKQLRRQHPPETADTVDVVFIISDGGKGEGVRRELNHIEDTIAALSDAITLTTIGVGSVVIDEQCAALLGADALECRTTEPVPLIIHDAGGGFVDYLRKTPEGRESRVLTSELDEDVLRTVARYADGQYYFFKDAKSTLAAFKETVLRYRVRVGFVQHSRFEPAATPFLLVAFAAIFFSFGLHTVFISFFGMRP